MGKYVYKNISDQEIAIIGVGLIAPGQEFESDTPVENQNCELISKPKDDRQVGLDVATEPTKGVDVVTEPKKR